MKTWWAALPSAARQLLVVACFGVLTRFVLAALSIGSNDATIWRVFAEYINVYGLERTYLDLDGRPGSPVPVFNHPPPAALYAALCWKIAEATGARFAILLKLAGLFAEIGTMTLLWRIWRTRSGPTVAASAVAAYSFAFCVILVSGYHANTDCVYAFLTLLAVWLLSQARPLEAGLTMALAINVKLIPIFAVPAMVASFRDWRSFFKFSIGGSVAILPFLPYLVNIPQKVFQSVVAYTPIFDYWGVVGVLLASANSPRFNEVVPSLLEGYTTHYRYFLLGPILAAAIWSRLRRVALLESVLLALTLFLALTPGFGVQYTALVTPVMFAVSYRWGLRWATSAGAFIFIPYFAYHDRGFPWNSTFTGRFPMPAPLLGFLAWALLVSLVVALVRRDLGERALVDSEARTPKGTAGG